MNINLQQGYMQLQQNAPDLAQFIGAFVVAGQTIEMIDEPLYDRLQYPTAGGGQFSFFQTGIGAGLSSETAAGAGVAKSLADTNLEGIGGQLPAPQAFWVANIQADFDPGSVSTASTYTNEIPTLFNATAAATVQAGANDKYVIMNSGFLQFSIGEKAYHRGAPLRAYPPDVNMRVDAALSIAGTNGQPAAYGVELLRSEGAMGMPVRKLDPGVGIPTSMNFKVTMNFPIVVATPSGFNGRLQCRLGGWKLRAVQ